MQWLNQTWYSADECVYAHRHDVLPLLRNDGSQIEPERVWHDADDCRYEDDIDPNAPEPIPVLSDILMLIRTSSSNNSVFHCHILRFSAINPELLGMNWAITDLFPILCRIITD